jgi:outer membrane lipoprotein SlyB
LATSFLAAGALAGAAGATTAAGALAAVAGALAGSAAKAETATRDTIKVEIAFILVSF